MPIRDSKLTVLVPIADIFYRFAHNLSRNSFESHATVSQTVACPAAREKAPEALYSHVLPDRDSVTLVDSLLRYA